MQRAEKAEKLGERPRLRFHTPALLLSVHTPRTHHATGSARRKLPPLCAQHGDMAWVVHHKGNVDALRSQFKRRGNVLRLEHLRAGGD